MFHRAFLNSIIDKHQHMHFTFNNILVKNVDFNVKMHKKYIKILRHVSIITGHHQGLFCTSLHLLNYLKNTEFKILKINPGLLQQNCNE